MKTAGLVRTQRPSGATCAEITFVNQPNLPTSAEWAFQSALDQSPEQKLQRLSLRDINQHLCRDVGIEATVASCLHARNFAESGGSVHPNSAEFSNVGFFTLASTGGFVF